MRPADVKRLMEAMVASGVHELELEQRDDAGALTSRVRLVRHEHLAVASAGADTLPSETALLAAREPVPSADVPAVTPAGPTQLVDVLAPLVDVLAPIVGTYYASPAPDAPNYVKVGDRVQPGSVLCIIEAMKLMNEIEAEVAGTVVELLVTDEDPVEYGQVLFRIDPS